MNESFVGLPQGAFRDKTAFNSFGSISEPPVTLAIEGDNERTGHASASTLGQMQRRISCILLVSRGLRQSGGSLEYG